MEAPIIDRIEMAVNNKLIVLYLILIIIMSQKITFSFYIFEDGEYNENIKIKIYSSNTESILAFLAIK